MSTRYSDVESREEDSDDGGCYDDDYYNDYEDDDDDDEMDTTDPATLDPEYFEFTCFNEEGVERLFKESVESLCASLPVKPSIAKLLLHSHRWDTSEITAAYKVDASKLLIDSKIKPSKPPGVDTQTIRNSETMECSVCFLSDASEGFHGLACGHFFCKDCWCTHFEMKVNEGITTSLECMGESCCLLVPEDFALNILNKSILREKYKSFSFVDYVESHRNLRFCPGTDCNIVIFGKECQAKRVICEQCKTSFCFKCGSDYHAPTDCDTMKKWLIKCVDDSGTANYLTAYTKDCPKCSASIEKNGGCNHMRCSKCNFHFCWMCLADWKTHGGQDYNCNWYRGNPNIANQSAATQAREALRKYLFYFERWENHAKSLRLEEENRQKIINQINAKVMAGEGTWIDWQYLKDAAALLAKCRHTLQYTYSFAYYLQSGQRKVLFEYQQAQLEAEIESLSWKLENTTDRGEIENQMDVAEKRRTTLLKDFLS